MKTLPYTTWPSALTPEHFANSAARLGEIQADTNAVYWMQQHPQEQGRQVIMCWDGNTARDITRKDVDIGNRVNEYGGGSYLPCGDVIYYSDRKTNRLYVNEQALSDGKLALAAPTTIDKQFIIAVAEEKTTPVKQSLVLIDTENKNTKTLDDTIDFYANPHLNYKNQLAYLTWHMPDMPWQSSSIHVAQFAPEQGKLSNKQTINLPGYQSQPSWHDETLYFVSDHENGFGQLYRYQNKQAQKVCDNWPAQADMAIPMWNLNQQIYAVIDANTIAVIFAKMGQHYCGIIKNGKLKILDLPYVAYGDHIVYWRGKLVFQAATQYQGFAIIAYDLSTGETQTLSELPANPLQQEDISVAQSITFTSKDGGQAHAFYYPPKHHTYSGEPDTLPPLMVLSHGGPTSSTHCGFASKIQFWTNRGFAVVDVNYRGSTGFGRDYWQALKHQWGVIDVNDAIEAAEYCVQQGWVDGNKLLIRGNSAGGFLTLNAITQFTNFTAAAVYYGIADLSAFLDTSHRFEEGYNAWLLGPYPEQKQLYIDRSPINHIDQLNTPTIFFHGLDDKVVPPSQSQAMYQALKKKGIKTELTTFEGEGHGFRGAETLITTLEQELRFYQDVMDF
jgi:dipeptidyl aminopeptidase/acylaminoacyl peptidase